ncbi:hypothetical protein J1TS5_61640 [Paenibacillus macerans]|uniref:hypothetical protein n=1 Tax=Paenibacillus macerans TaxID=44252 RepID=UPI001B259112|nr:hypothetical protein [Paenibacillus macerans]GIP13994.1 hypothetical protein J1TS5_61640 [Paenibacillus macerans]
MSEQARRDRRLEKQIARRIEKRHGRRINATLNGGSIRNGRVISPDGVDMSHRFQILPVKVESAQRYARNRSAIGEFSAENGGYVWGLFKSSVTMEAQWAEYGLTQSDLARLMFIGTYTDYEGVLRHPNGRPITRESMSELIGLHRTKFDEFFSKLLAASIIKVPEDGAIYMSPDVFQRGKIAKGEYADRIRVYRDTVRSLYEKYGKGRSVRQLGIVYSVIPFVHRNMNIVCYNPLEKHDEDIKPITLDKLALLLGYQNATKFKGALRAIEINEQPVFAFVEDIHNSRKRRIVVNPRIIFAGNYEGLQACRALAVLFN